MSSVELAVRWTKAGVIIAVAVWELVQLARRREDLPLRVLAPGLVCLAFAATLGIHTPLLHPIQDFFGSSWRYLVNGAWSTMSFCFAAYFLLANPAIPAARRKRSALVELGVLVAALTIMVLVHEVAPATWHRPMSAEQYRSWPNIVWSFAVDGYALFAWGLGVARARALRRRLRHPWARAAFWLVMVGSTAMALGVDAVSLIKQAIRAVTPDADLGLLSALYSVGQLGGQFVLALGLALVPLGTALITLRSRVDRRRRARFARQLAPLWQTLVGEFPYIAVESTGPERDGGFDRLTVEITDGLSELARDCPTPAGDVRNPQVAANVIAAGLEHRAERRRAGEHWDPEPPYPRIQPDLSDWRERTRWMIAVSQELRTRGVLGKEPAHGTA